MRSICVRLRFGDVHAGFHVRNIKWQPRTKMNDAIGRNKLLGGKYLTSLCVSFRGRSARMERMATLEPLFVDVTWGAGGSTSDLTLAISANAQKYIGVEVLMHLTCTNLKVRCGAVRYGVV